MYDMVIGLDSMDGVNFHHNNSHEFNASFCHDSRRVFPCSFQLHVY
jgi:hypothetical protein